MRQEVLKQIKEHDLGANKLSFTVIWLTPEFAEFLLKTVPDFQRKVSRIRVNQFAQEIEAGKWRLNGESICLDNKGQLINGQHRCRAVIKAQRPIEISLIFDLDTSYFSSMDRGYFRNNAQILKMKGFVNTTQLSAVLNLIFQRENNYKLGASNLMSVENLLEKYKADMDLICQYVVMSDCLSSRLPYSGYTRSILGTCLYFIKKQSANPDMLTDFVERVKEMDWTDLEKCPVKAFIEKINMEAKKTDFKLKISREDQYNFFIHAWNRFSQGRSLSARSKTWASDTLIEIK